MLRKLLGLSAVLVLASTVFALVDPGVSGAATPVATGTVGCKITGSGKFGPKLTLAGSTTTVRIRFTATSTGGCGAQARIPGALVTISGVSIQGKGTLTSLSPGNANSCASFTAADTIGVVKVKFTWASVPDLRPHGRDLHGGDGTDRLGHAARHDPLPRPDGHHLRRHRLLHAVGEPGGRSGDQHRRQCGAGWGPYPGFTITPGSYITLP